jgi:vacuolar protein-sorting-associated protein 4
MKLTPCGPHEAGAKPMTWRQVDASKLLEPTVQAEDFFTVLKGVKASVGEKDIKKCHEWTEQYGLEGA